VHGLVDVTGNDEVHRLLAASDVLAATGLFQSLDALFERAEILRGCRGDAEDGGCGKCGAAEQLHT